MWQDARDYSTGCKSKVGIFRIVWEGEMGIFGILAGERKEFFTLYDQVRHETELLNKIWIFVNAFPMHTVP